MTSGRHWQAVPVRAVLSAELPRMRSSHGALGAIVGRATSTGPSRC